MNKVEIYVVADHCSDDTAACAQAAGVHVLTRHEGPQGKTYALAWAFDALTEGGVIPDLYLIVDATVQVEAPFLAAIVERWRRGEDIVTCHPMVSPENQTWYGQCLGLMLIHRNLQNGARERLGLSAMLDGRGMAYSRAYIQRFGWRLALPTGLRTTHPTEDWRHGIRVVEQGYRVAFADGALVSTPLRDSLTKATKQGARWERGRMVNASTHALRLLLHGLRQRHLVKVCAALDAIQPPVAILGAISLGLVASSVLVPSPGWSGITSFLPFMFTGLYGLRVILKGRQEGLGLTTVIWAPLYVAWRCVAFVLAWGFLDRIDLSWRRKNGRKAFNPSVSHSAPHGTSSH
jgi:cellulose synthase/poly-beta-1,6-N-acetylglucosamine synthase-like glycosyltransferase